MPMQKAALRLFLRSEFESAFVEPGFPARGFVAQHEPAGGAAPAEIGAVIASAVRGVLVVAVAIIAAGSLP